MEDDITQNVKDKKKEEPSNEKQQKYSSSNNITKPFNTNKENNDLISSPTVPHKNDFNFTQHYLSPKIPTINQKFFPSKADYFGNCNLSNDHIKRPLSPGNHSPILNYFSCLSSKIDTRMVNYYSPEANFANNSSHLSPFISSTNEQNFNFSPSNIFVNTNNTVNNNFSFPANTLEENPKTLQEKMENLARKTDAKDFIFRKYSDHSKSNQCEVLSDDEDEDNNGEIYTLSFGDGDGVEIEEQKNINQSNEQSKNNISTNINNNINNIIQDNKDDKIQKIKKETKSEITKTENTEKKESTEKPESLTQLLQNRKELPKPYIPNKYRNNNKELNQIYNSPNGFGFPSYAGNSDHFPESNYNNPYNQNIISGDITKNKMNNVESYYDNNQFMTDYMNNGPSKIGEFINYPKNDYIPSNDIIPNKMDYPLNSEDGYYNHFIYNGDKYQISQFKEYKKKDYEKTGEIPTISAADIVIAITQNNKKIKRIDPNTYLNESLEYLSYNIFPLAKDQAGCRFLQEKIDKDPINTTSSFYKAILPYVLPLVKDPFGNYLIQKLCSNLSPIQIKKFLEIMTPTILDIGSNSHGTRVIQNIINYLNTPDLVDYFFNSIKPYIIPLLKELNGTHIINKLMSDHPECAPEINKIILENCSLLATHRHGCCILQKIIDGSDKILKKNLINNLIDNCIVLIIDQFGNYVIQSILLLNDPKFSSAIASKICDNLPYYSKHRYSSNVIEKCFDFCGKKDRKKLIDRISTPEIISELILDEHGNYVIQKALNYSDQKDQEIILNNIVPLVPKIKCTPFGEKLLSRLLSFYPSLAKSLNIKNGNNEFNINSDSISQNQNNYKKNKKKIFPNSKKGGKNQSGNNAQANKFNNCNDNKFNDNNFDMNYDNSGINMDYNMKNNMNKKKGKKKKNEFNNNVINSNDDMNINSNVNTYENVK